MIHTNVGVDRGQGANNAFFDSYCFVEAMKAVQGGAPIEQAISDYDEKILKRGQEEVQISKAQTFFTHDWENFINSPVKRRGYRFVRVQLTQQNGN